MTEPEALALKELNRGHTVASYWVYRAMGIKDRWPAKKGYPVLRKLVKRGLIEGVGGGVNIYHYKITEAGRAALANT